MNELDALARLLATTLKERKETIAVAESSAGGLISAAMLSVPGASAYFLGGGVIYTQAARRGLLQVPDEAVKGIRSSSEPYALLKARTIRELLGPPGGSPRPAPPDRPAIATAIRRGTRVSPWRVPSSARLRSRRATATEKRTCGPSRSERSSSWRRRWASGRSPLDADRLLEHPD